MIVKPEQIAFESRNDIVDYVSKGIVPSRKNFEKVKFAINYPTPEGATPEAGQINIPKNLFIDCDNKTMVEILDRVYKNRVKQRNITLATIGIICAALLLKGSSNKNKVEELDDCSTCPLIDIDD